MSYTLFDTMRATSPPYAPAAPAHDAVMLSEMTAVGLASRVCRRTLMMPPGVTAASASVSVATVRPLPP